MTNVTASMANVCVLLIAYVVEIWDNKVPNHQFGYPSAWHAMILLVDNSDRIASVQRETKYTIAANPSDTHVR